MKDLPTRHAIDLAGTWTLQDTETGTSCDMQVPGDAITALHRAGRIPDPYAGRNEHDLRWIPDRDWVLSRNVELAATDAELVLDGLDTVAEVRVNGIQVLKAANMFRSHRADISQAARIGTNKIAITFRSALRAADELQARMPFPVPSHPTNCPIPNGNMLRKQQCDFGWDWNVALAPFGLYSSARIEPKYAARIEALRVTQTHGRGTVSVMVEALVQGKAAEVSFEIDGQTATTKVVGGIASAVFNVDNPRLWWPNGQGEQPLYDLTATCGDQTAHRRIGLVHYEHLTQPGRFALRVNGREVFAKGANWIPADALAGRIDRDAVRDLLRSAADANMNMIRVWGGGRYEPGWFYDLCDELGLMVWQDFMFSCNLYPSTPDFLAEVAGEVRENALRLNHHACIALWCGDNELVGALDWYPESRQNRDRYLANYDRLNRTIETALKEALPGALWWPSSPSPGVLDFGDAWHDDTRGDMHFWSVWHEGRDFDHYRDVSPRFCSEFGFQSFPSMNVIRRFAAPEDLNIASPVMDSHQKDPGGNARITGTMFRYFRFPNGFADFVYLSQVQQGLAIHTAVTHWRGLKPTCMGTLYWQLNDTWPTASWSSLDHGGDWKLLHHMARRFYAPLTVVAVPSGDQIELRAVNDTGADASLTVKAYAMDMAGALRPLGSVERPTPPDRAVELIKLRADSLGPQDVLYFTWASGDSTSEDIFAPLPWKAYDLPQANVALAAGRAGDNWHLTLTARAAAFFVSVEPDQPGRLSDNAFLLRPGVPRHLTFTPADPGAPVAFATRDLHSATYPVTH